MFGTLIGLGFATVSASAKEYTVKSGDSLWSIAKDNNTTTKAVVNANSLSSANAVILPNQKLTIPTGAKADKSPRIKPLTNSTSSNNANSIKSKQSTAKNTTNKTATSGWTTMVATAYDPEVAAGGQGTSIPTGTGVAAALSRYPKGTQLEIKFQDGHTENRVVNDTGTFAYSNPNQLDISMTNSEAMQFGRQSIQVRVVG